MAITPDLIYCAGGNRRFAQIAIEAGFKYGSQMPATVYFPNHLHFIDVDPDSPPLQWNYVSKLRRFRPFMASVHDWHRGRNFSEIMLRAEEVAEYVTDAVLIIPKVPGTIKTIPREINSRRVVLGYSVPTRHGRTDVATHEFAGWPVHLLGGSPHAQLAKFTELSQVADVISADGNMAQKLSRKCAFYDYAKTTRRGYWPTLEEYDGRKWGDGSKSADAPYEAFRRSCQNIIEAWRKS